MYKVEPIIYHRAQKEPFEFVETMDGNYLSHLLYEAGKRENTPKMSIGVLGYRHLEDTKRCVESVLRFVGDIDYELILMDNGSMDNNETLNYYQTVPTMRKKIIQVDAPLGPDYGAMLGTRLMYEYASGDIFVFLGNDNIITENALQNMITCLDSSPDIGLVTPMSSNAYMCQNPGLSYSNFEEMFAVAKKFNQSDPRKWQERMEMATVATAIKREVLVQSGFYGFWTAESDLCHRVRKAGYKTILLGDTWVCHNHDYSTKKDSQGWLAGTDNSKKKLEHMQKMQLDHMGGLYQFEDIMVFEYPLLSLVGCPVSELPKLLVVDVKAGQPLLDLRNKLREFGVFNTQSTAFTTDAKYYSLLYTAAEKVYCDRIQFLANDLQGQKFDIVLLGKPVNLFPDPEGLIRVLMGLLETNGQLLFKMRNCCDVRMLQLLAGASLEMAQPEQQIMTIEDVKRIASQCGATSMQCKRQMGNYSADTINAVPHILGGIKGIDDVQKATENLLTESFLFQVM